jgi:RES domain-containing protein
MRTTAWRIVKAQFKDSAFDGRGAQLAGGRWNKPGVPMIYTADSLALAALEIIVHLSHRDLLRKLYVRIPVQFDSGWVKWVDPADLRADWDSYPPSVSTQRIGTQWALKQESLVLRVPSTVIREQFNYLINPAHPDFSKLSIGKAGSFAFDPRLAASKKTA